MTAHTSTEDVLAPELEAIATAAADRLRGEVADTGQDDSELHHALAHAASAAIAAGHSLGAIADPENVGQRRARDQLRGDVVRQISRAARRKRDTEAEYEQAVIRAVRLGLTHREVAAAAEVTHGTVRSILDRTDKAPDEPQPTATPTPANDHDSTRPPTPDPAGS
jgi:DNA-binding NarL/FixJ family response regulator